jgi:tetratricopeptide (TPR) repeat protein
MKNLLIILLYYSLLFWQRAGGEINAQQIQLENLQKLLLKNNNGNLKELQLLNAIAPVQVNINPNEALVNADKAIAMAQKLNNQKELAVAYNNKGFILWRKSDFDVAKTFLNKALKINTDIHNLNGIADNLSNTAEVLRRQGETDSAKVMLEKSFRLYEQTKNVRGKADVYYYLALVNRDLSDFKTMLQLCNKAIGIYNLLNDSTKLALAIDAKSVYYYFISDIESALKYANTAMELNVKNNNLYGLAMSFTSLGHMYGELPNFPKAVENHIKSLKIHEQMGNLQMQGNMNVNIGLDYFMFKQYALALQYTSKGIKQMDELKINNGQYRMALAYMGAIYLELGNTKKSFEYTNKSIELCLAAYDEWALSDAYNYLGNNYLNSHQYYPAILNFKKAIALQKKLNVNLTTPEFFVGLSKAISLASDDELLRANITPSQKNELVLNYLQTALNLGAQTKNNLQLRNTLEQLSFFYEKQGDLSKSFTYFQQYIAYKDSITNKDNTNAIAFLQLQYDTEKKEQQITLLIKESQLRQTELQKQNTTRNVFITASLMIALLAGIVFNLYRVKQKANAAIEQAMNHLKSTQEQLIESEKLASLGKLTADVAKEIEVPVLQISKLASTNRMLMQHLSESAADAENLKNNLLEIYQFGKDADAVVKRVLIETRKIQS